jgi:hypothetical protein
MDQNNKFEEKIDSLRIRGKSIKAFLTVITFQEKKTWVSYIPSIDIASSGDTVKESIEAVKEAVIIFFEYTIKKNTLLIELKKFGWAKNPLSNKNYIARNIDNIKKNNSYLQNIIASQEIIQGHQIYTT